MKEIYLIVLFLLIGLGTAEDILDGNYSISIPESWYIAENNTNKTIITDNVSAIRIDRVYLTDPELNSITYYFIHDKREFLQHVNPEDVNWRVVKDLTPWYVNDAVCEYYKTAIINADTSFSNGGSGLSIKPDSEEYATFFMDQYNLNWVIVWTKLEYNNSFIGIRAIFSPGKTYEMVAYEWYGVDDDKVIQKPLFDVLTSFAFGERETVRKMSILDSI